MATLKTLRKGIKLTANEREVLNFLNEELKGSFGSQDSHLECSDIAKELEMEKNSTNTVIQALIRKGLVQMDEAPSELVSFVEQEEMVYEVFIKPTNTVEAKIDAIANTDNISGTDNPAKFGKHNPNFDKKEAPQELKKAMSKETLKNVKKAKAEAKADKKVTVVDVAASPVKAVSKGFRKYKCAQDIIDVITKNEVRNLSHLNDKFYGAYSAMIRNGWKQQVIDAKLFLKDLNK